MHTVGCGKRIPDSEHAISVSLPTMADVVGYEKQLPAVMQSICSGYPRFICHWMVQRVQAHLGDQIVAVRDVSAAEQLQRRMDCRVQQIKGLPFGALELPHACSPALKQHVREFLQHTGLQLSSRQAEDYLLQQGLLTHPQQESFATIENAEHVISDCLARLYETNLENVALFPSGMSAFYAVFDAIDRLQRPQGRGMWLQVGWLYLDTSAILDKYAAGTRVFGVDGLNELEAYLHEHHLEVSAITTEVMTNPLLQTADVVRLSQLCRQYDIPFVIDTSMPTPVNVDVLPYADVVIESLTKFAGGHADVMSGAAVFGGGGRWPADIRSQLHQSKPYKRDLNVLVNHIQDYEARMRHINENTEMLRSYFEGHPRVRQVFGARQAGSREAYEAVRKSDGGYGGVISVVFDQPLAQIYDRLALLKGPSFGTVFTLCMPYVYLAHYNLVATSSGRAELLRHGVDPELLRVSVGLEPVEEVIAAFEAAFGG